VAVRRDLGREDRMKAAFYSGTALSLVRASPTIEL
jgi:hypothetical protein